MMDDITRAQERELRCTASSTTRNRRRRASTRRRAMHPMIVINGRNIVAAKPLRRSETTGAIEAAGRIKRGSHAAGFPVPHLSGRVASPRGGKTRPI